MRGGDVIGIARQAIANDFAVNLRAARLGPFIFFKHDNTSTFAHHKAVTIPVIRAAGLFGRVIETGAKRAGLRKTGNTDGADGRFRATCQHDVGIVHRDHPRCVPDRMRSGRAGGDDRVVRAHQPVLDRNLP